MKIEEQKKYIALTNEYRLFDFVVSKHKQLVIRLYDPFLRDKYGRGGICEFIAPPDLIDSIRRVFVSLLAESKKNADKEMAENLKG